MEIRFQHRNLAGEHKHSVYGNILATQNMVGRPTTVASSVDSLDLETLSLHLDLLNPVCMLARSPHDLYTVWEAPDLFSYRN